MKEGLPTSTRRALGSLRREGAKWVNRRKGTVPLLVGSTTDFRTRRAALDERDRILASSSSAAVQGNRIRFDAFARVYSARFLAIQKEGSRRTFQPMLDRLTRSLSTLYVDQVNLNAAQACVASLHAAGYVRSTIKQHTDLLRRVLAAARRLGYAATEISPRTIALPKVAGAPRERRQLDDAEIRAIVAHAREPWSTLFLVMAHTGIRISEALALRWQDVDLDAAVLRIRSNAPYGRLASLKSRNSQADIPMVAELVQALRFFREHRWAANDAGLLFSNGAEHPLRPVGVRQHHWKGALARAGVPYVGPHALRHAAATRLFRAGAPAPVVKALLRHGSMRTTLSYVHMTEADQVASVARASKLLDGFLHE